MVRQALAIPILCFCVGTVHAQNVLNISGLEFDGVNDYAQVNAKVVPSSGDFTVCVWARAESLPSGYTEIVSQDPGTGGRPFYLRKAADGTIRASSSTTVPFPKDGGWHHYAVVKDSSNVILYVDGVLKHSRTTAVVNPAGAVFRVGRQYGNYAE